MKTAKQIIEILLKATGQFTSVKFQSVVKTAAAFKGLNILKITNAVVRSGIDFSNLTSVKDGIANGERNEVGSLPWGTWINFPYIIGHNDKEYVRLYPSLAPNHIPKVSYFVDGIETPKAEILQYLTASKVASILEPKIVECFTLTNTNILDVVEMA
jgi:hypothetical protein